jgi:SAM-dependent methyltransferase
MLYFVNQAGWSHAMCDLDNQVEYWDRVAWEKEFTIPINQEKFRQLVPRTSRVLDYGCGYGRILAELQVLGYANLLGVDTFSELIERGASLHPALDLRFFNGGPLPFADESFDAVLLVAVLTCIPGDETQRRIVAEATRVLSSGGVLCLADFLLNGDERNQRRYQKAQGKYDAYGVFELPEGVVLRHHDPDWVAGLTAGFSKLFSQVRQVETMNGHLSKSLMYFGRKI